MSDKPTQATEPEVVSVRTLERVLRRVECIHVQLVADGRERHVLETGKAPLRSGGLIAPRVVDCDLERTPANPEPSAIGCDHEVELIGVRRMAAFDNTLK